MIEEQRDQLRKAQLYIAKEIKRICEANDINYFLDCGSMLGAVRHQGFIPWDDDMDIGMRKEDYNRFLEIAQKELNHELFLDNYSTNPNNALVFTKVRLRGTRYIEAKGNADTVHNEIFVDVFPYYNISDDENKRKIEGILMSILSQAIMSKSGYKVWKGEKISKRIKFLPTDMLGKVLTKKAMHRWIDQLFNKNTDSKRVCIHSGSCYDYWFFPKEIFDEYIDTQFEETTFRIPRQYDIYLSTVYGDYMTMPPIEKRITHNIETLDLGVYRF